MADQQADQQAEPAPEPRRLIVKGNAKMGGAVYLFNLPARETCTPTAWCLRGRKGGKPQCYALRGNHTWRRTQASQAARLAAARRPDFVPRIVDEIQAAGPLWFRLHSAGDFFSREYIDNWRAIAEACPETTFRTSTRRRDFVGPIGDLAGLPNFVIRESLDDDRPVPVMGLPYAAIDTLPIAWGPGVLKCSNHCPTCDYGCWCERVNVSFEVH